ncbi:MAG: hypothetical protein JSU68_15000 [Phycisphaerales bacterium]|nr:MAG: hypothetical protein JSU68_15000 [Phycisphaerales bacterium]
MNENPTPSGSISPDAFLKWEAEIRSAEHRPLTTGALRRFRQVVRSSTKLWLAGPGRRLRAARVSDGCRLHFQFLHQDRWLTCFFVQAHHLDGLFTLKGPCPERKRLGVSRSAMHSLDGLWESWRQWPESEGLGRLTVTVYLHDWPPTRIAKYAASADKAVAALQKHAGKPAGKAAGKATPARTRTASPKGRSATAKRRN